MPPTEFAQATAERLLGVLDLAEGVHSSMRGLPLEGSPGAAERSENADLAAPGWGETPVTAAQVDPKLRLTAADDHLRALATLLQRDPPSPLALYTVTRGCLEAASRAHWLLSAHSARDRVGRWTSERVSTLRESYGALHKTPRDTPHRAQHLAQSKALRETLERTCVARGVRTKKVPGSEELVAGLFADSTLMARAAYSLMSGVAHAEGWALREFLRVILGDETPDPGTVTVALLQTDQTVATNAAYCLLAHRTSTRSALSLWGVAADPAWERAIERALVAASAIAKRPV